MVNVCGKCEYYQRTEMDQQGNYYNYCGKVDELFSSEPLADGETSETPTLKVNFNDAVCQHYKKRRH